MLQVNLKIFALAHVSVSRWVNSTCRAVQNEIVEARSVLLFELINCTLCAID